jgi:putative FmdB family regulatory protein
MPTYSYRCPTCGHGFQKLEKMTAAPQDTCPACGGRSQRQITGGAGLALKGSDSAEPTGGSCCGGGACGCH